MASAGEAGALAAWATRRVLVLPVQGVQPAALPGWRPNGDVPRLQAAADSALLHSLRDAGMQRGWVLLDAVARTSARNPAHAGDPGTIRAADAVRTLERDRDEDIPEPAASQLRLLAGFTDARYALVPLEVRFEQGEFADAGRAVLRVAILDIRGSRLSWLGSVAGYDAADPLTALQNLGRRLAELVAAR